MNNNKKSMAAFYDVYRHGVTARVTVSWLLCYSVYYGHEQISCSIIDIVDSSYVFEYKVERRDVAKGEERA